MDWAIVVVVGIGAIILGFLALCAWAWTVNQRDQPEGIPGMLASGWRIESETSTHVVLVKGHRVNHILHLLLTLVTGVWVFVWIALAISGGERRRMVSRD